jgi:hypothetical protein
MYKVLSIKDKINCSLFKKYNNLFFFFHIIYSIYGSKSDKSVSGIKQSQETITTGVCCSENGKNKRIFCAIIFFLVVVIRQI